MLLFGIPQKKSREINAVMVCPGGFTSEECDQFLTTRSSVDFSANGLLLQKLAHLIDGVNSNLYGFILTDLITSGIYTHTPLEPSPWQVALGSDPLTSLRKLTCLVCLTPCTSYEGGEIYFEPSGTARSQEKGDVLVFPAYYVYRFSPLLQGTYQILVSWACGPAFR